MFLSPKYVVPSNWMFTITGCLGYFVAMLCRFYPQCAVVCAICLFVSLSTLILALQAMRQHFSNRTTQALNYSSYKGCTHVSVAVQA